MDERMKTTGPETINGLTAKRSPEAEKIAAMRGVIERYLQDTRVVMAGGGYSDRICTLCENRMTPGSGSSLDCVCTQARELLSGHD